MEWGGYSKGGVGRVEGISGGNSEGEKESRDVGSEIFLLFFSPPKKYHAPIFHHTPKYESPFQTVDK